MSIIQQDAEYGSVLVYALIDPTTDALRYIGKSIDPEPWLAAQVSNKRKTWTRVGAWIADLARAGLSPKLHILEHCRHHEIKLAEYSWIARKKAEGCDLLNTFEVEKQRKPRRRDTERGRNSRLEMIRARLPWLPRTFASALLDIIEGLRCWSSWDVMVELYGKTMTELVAAELVEIWKLPRERMVTLTPFAAEKLGASVVEVGTNSIPRWRLGLEDPWFMPERYKRYAKELPLSFAGHIAANEAVPQILIDELTKQPHTLFQGPNPGKGLRPNGIPIVRPKPKKRPKKARRKKRGGAKK